MTDEYAHLLRTSARLTIQSPSTIPSHKLSKSAIKTQCQIEPFHATSKIDLLLNY